MREGGEREYIANTFLRVRQRQRGEVIEGGRRERIHSKYIPVSLS